jgi:hypothetical protein
MDGKDFITFAVGFVAGYYALKHYRSVGKAY